MEDQRYLCTVFRRDIVDPIKRMVIAHLRVRISHHEGRHTMFGLRWRVFRLWGIPISIDASWLIVVMLLTWTMAEEYRRELPGLNVGEYVSMGLGTAVIFFACILLHELGHATVAEPWAFLFGALLSSSSEAWRSWKASRRPPAKSFSWP